MDKPKQVKYATCRFCKHADLIWEQHDGKFVMFESFGLPHLCDEKDKFFAEESSKKKKEYADYKELINAMPNGMKCTECEKRPAFIEFHPMNMYCSTCDGRGIITDQVKKNLLYRKRTQIWPNMAAPRYKRH